MNFRRSMASPPRGGCGCFSVIGFILIAAGVGILFLTGTCDLAQWGC